MAVLTTPQILTGDWVDLGSQQNINKHITQSLCLTITVNDSKNIRVRILIKPKEVATEYPLMTTINNQDGVARLVPSEELLSFVDENKAFVGFKLPDDGDKFQVQIKTGIVGTIAGVVDEAVLMSSDISDAIGNVTDGSRDHMLEIAQGHVTGIRHINKFGQNPDVDTATDPEDIWDGGGIWVPPTVARTHDFASTSANDAGTVVSSGTATGGSLTTLINTGATFITDGVVVGDAVLNDTIVGHSIVTSVDSEIQLTHEAMHEGDPNKSGHSYRIVTPASTGASFIHIVEGLDSNMEEISEFIVLNGTSNVATINSYYRIYVMHNEGAGSNGVNVGIITATAQIDGTITTQIGAGNGQTLMAIYTVPAGHTAYITAYYATILKSASSTGAASITLNIKNWAYLGIGTAKQRKHVKGLVTDGSSEFVHEFRPYLKVTEKKDIFMTVEEVTANDTNITGGFDLILVDN